MQAISSTTIGRFETRKNVYPTMHSSQFNRNSNCENGNASSRSPKPPKVLLNDRVCVVAPPSSSTESLQPRLCRGPSGSSADALSVHSGGTSAKSLNATPILARSGALRMKLQMSLSQEFFSTSMAETDVHSACDTRFEPVEHPPSIESLRDATHKRFSVKWLKYMYAKFKNECPTGRMRVHEFKRLMGAYVPDRISDAYLERMFYALCGGASSGYTDQLTFRDLMVSLASVFEGDPRQNAEWTMRLIGASPKGDETFGASAQVTVDEFSEFVKSVYLLVGRKLSSGKPSFECNMGDCVSQSAAPPSARSSDSNDSSTTQTSVPRQQKSQQPQQWRMMSSASPAVIVVKRATLMAIRKRAITVFKELDTENRGYLTVDNFERLFRLTEIST